MSEQRFFRDEQERTIFAMVLGSQRFHTVHEASVVAWNAIAVYRSHIRCEYCGGSGRLWNPPSDYVPCSDCDGTGALWGGRDTMFKSAKEE